jgi:hypothetical protein
MPMSDEAKARLRAASQAKKGRDKLASLDRTAGLVGLDYVQEQDAPPDARVTGLGYLGVYEPRDGGHPCWHDAVRKNGSLAKITRTDPRGRRSGSFPWIALRYGPAPDAPDEPDWLSAEFARRWPAEVRRVQVWKFAGPGNPRTPATVLAVRARRVVAWFRFLWPAPGEWGERARTYFTAYSDAYVHRFPGVGQRLVLKEDSPNHHQFPPGAVVAVRGWREGREENNWHTVLLLDPKTDTGGWCIISKESYTLVD